MTTRRLGFFVAAMVLAVAGLVRPAASSTALADTGTLDDQHTSLTYTHGPFTTANPSKTGGVFYYVCPPSPSPVTCDDYSLVVNLGAANQTGNHLHIQIQWPDPTADFDLFVLDSAGNTVAQSQTSNDPEQVDIPAVNDTYDIRVLPANPMGQSFTGSVQLTPDVSGSGGGSAPPDAAQPYSGIYPRFQNYQVPHSQGGNQEGEPSIGFNPLTGNVLYQAGLQTFRVNFDDATSPARATWQDVTAFNQKASLDPILYTDPNTGRTFASQLTGQDSLTSFSDNDGTSWTPSQGGGIPSGVDHQSIGGGPYSKSATVQPPTTSSVTGYKDAVYYCSQDIAAAFCARSDNGGLTFGPGVPIYNLTQCGGIHGHVKVAPDGTVYVPNRNCTDVAGASRTGLAVSTDDGVTWTVRTIPDSTAGIGNDPSIGIASDGTIYEGYQGADGHARIAVSHDRGVTWSKSVDVGAPFGIQGMVFPEVAAGDPGRAAFAFLGTPAGGNFQGFGTFQGIWHAYIATTYDGGKTWATVDATPDDPVQRGSICISGTTCSNTPNDRNLLDFMDLTTDKQGRILLAYPDGCVNECVTADPTKPAVQTNSFTSYATIVRQSGGSGLYAGYDTGGPTVPARPPVTATTTANSSTATVSWQQPDNGGSPITQYNVFAGSAPNSLTQVASTDKTYVSLSITPGQTMYYEVQAVNGVGAGPLSPLATLHVITQNVQCTVPGVTAISDATGDQTGSPYNNDLDVTEVDVAEPPSLFGPDNLAFTIHVADLSTVLPGHQWRVFWGDGTGAGRYYVGADWNGTKMTFTYGTIMDGGPEGGPSLVTATNPALGGSWSEADNVITVIVPKSGVGNPQVGSALPGLEARTFTGQGGVDVFGRAAAIDVADGEYYLEGNAGC